MPTTIQALQIMVFLLPGFITASLINMLVFSKGRTDLDKVVEALAYSFVVFTIYTLFFDSLPVQLTDKGEIAKIIYDKNAFISIFGIAVAIGLVVSWSKTHDLHMKILRLDFLRFNDSEPTNKENNNKERYSIRFKNFFTLKNFKKY